jgi:hypothetical protein
MLNWMFVNGYFDGDEYDGKNEIKYYVDDKHYWFLDPSQRIEIATYVKENNAILHDDLFTNLFYPPQNLTFFQMFNVMGS